MSSGAGAAAPVREEFGFANGLPDLYQFLQLPRNATDEDIKRRVRKMSLVFHPDNYMQESEHVQRLANERISFLNHANEVLTDPVRRKLYDELGHDGLKQLTVAGPTISPEQLTKLIQDAKEEAKERKALESAHLEGVLLTGVDCSNFLDPYESSMRTAPEVQRFFIHQMVVFPLEKERTKLRVGGSILAMNGLGLGGLFVGLQHNLDKKTVIDSNLQLGLGQGAALSIFRNFDEETSGKVIYSLEREGFNIEMLGIRQLGSNWAATIAYNVGRSSGVAIGASRTSDRLYSSVKLKAGLNGIGLHGAMARALSGKSYIRSGARLATNGADISVGFGHRFSRLFKVATSVGLALDGVRLTVKLQHSAQAFSVPVRLTESPSLKLALALTALPAALFYLIRRFFLRPNKAQRRLKKLAARHDKYRSQLERGREDSMAELVMMHDSYARKLKAETIANGLVILKAEYGYLHGSKEAKEHADFPCVIDVTVPLMFAVDDSELVLTSDSKSRMTGFYDPCPWELRKQLRIRFKLDNKNHEIVLNDDEPVIINKDTIMHLGSSQ